MADTINWIHFTDLHLGVDEDSWLWPRVKHDLFRDLSKLSTEVDGWDVVFFTGDVVQFGKAEEYDQLNAELEKLWRVLEKAGQTPKLCVVPGNHDLIRPSADSATTKTLTQLWSSDPELRRQFWRQPECEYRAAVDAYFENYTNWLARASVPLLGSTTGALPGDFAATLKKGKAALGIVGLNSTFLQIIGGDMKGRLDVHVSQLNAVCGGDPDEWLTQRTAAVLLTHHPQTWLTPQGVEHFRQEIYPPGRFLVHLCGHQHEPESFELSEAGSAPRRVRQGPSLFGLEYWEGATPQQRIHGYNAGQFVFETQSGFEKLWPRISVKGRHGGLNLCPDHTYSLREGDCVITPFEYIHHPASPSVELERETKAESSAADADVHVELLEKPPDEETAKRKLASCSRLTTAVRPQHVHVRQDEQSACDHELRKSRCVWLIADWGAGEEGFLATVIDRFRTPTATPEAFHLKCDEASDIDALESLFPQQFGIPLQPFCHLAASLKGAFLVLDDIHPNLCSGDGVRDLRRVVSAVLDYCSDIRVILVSRLAPQDNTFPSVELRPLDAPDVRTYLLYHPDATTETKDPDAIEKLHERSEGLPMHLDRMLKGLSVAPLSAVLGAEMERETSSSAEEVPPALIHTVAKLQNSGDKRSRRSFRLLKVLSVLPYGETLDALHHYLSTEPFFLENALQLKELALLDVVALQKTSPQAKANPSSGLSADPPKLLKVPRQVRDYVQTLLTEDERLDIVLAGLERFFGREWRDGKIRPRTIPFEHREYLASGAGNEFALVHHLIAHARSVSDNAATRRGAAVGIAYARHLKGLDRYRDLTLVAGALTQLLPRDEQPDQWSQLAYLFGEGLRMAGKNESGLVYLRAALEVGEESLTDEEKASVWLSVSLAEQKLDVVDAAVAAAREVMRIEKPKSASHLHAETIVAELTTKGSARAKRLTELETLARGKGYNVLADSIALDFARNAENPTSKIKHLDKVLKSGNRGYNQARAIVAKAEAVKGQGGTPHLHGADLATLCISYSYLHAQRFSALFDRCHEQLWQIFESRGDSEQLLRLFRHSSFLWRIRGDEGKEAKYLDRLQRTNVRERDARSNGLLSELQYFLRRLQVVIVEAVAQQRGK